MTTQLITTIIMLIIAAFALSVVGTTVYYGIGIIVDEYKAKKDDEEKARYATRCIITSLVVIAIIAIPTIALRFVFQHYDVPVLNTIHNWLNPF